MRPKGRVLAACTFAGLLQAMPAAASERIIEPIGPAAARQRLAIACPTPSSAGCQQAYAAAAREAADDLVRLAQRRHPRAPDLARRAADSAYPELRVGAARALGELWSETPQTAVLAELLDDPVPAVRGAARRSLRSQNDPRAILLARRADQFGGDDDDPRLAADKPVAPAGLGLPMPSDAVYLFFASDPADGRKVFLTNEPVATVAARFAKVGKGPYTRETYRAAVMPAEEQEAADESAEESQDEADDSGDSDSDMPSAEEMARAMAMAQQMMAKMSQQPGTIPGQPKVSGIHELDSALGEKYWDAEIFGDVRFYLIERANGKAAAIAIYRDAALGRTEVAVHTQP